MTSWVKGDLKEPTALRLDLPNTKCNTRTSGSIAQKAESKSTLQSSGVDLEPGRNEVSSNSGLGECWPGLEAGVSTSREGSSY